MIVKLSEAEVWHAIQSYVCSCMVCGFDVGDVNLNLNDGIVYAEVDVIETEDDEES